MPPVFRGIKVHLHADRLHVSEQELDTDMEHAKIHVWAAVAARACASMQRARYLWLAPSTDSDSCSHLFCLRRLKRHQGTDFSSICRKEFDYGKTPSLYPPFHPLLPSIGASGVRPCRIIDLQLSNNFYWTLTRFSLTIGIIIGH